MGPYPVNDARYFFGDEPTEVTRQEHRCVHCLLAVAASQATTTDACCLSVPDDLPNPDIHCCDSLTQFRLNSRVSDSPVGAFQRHFDTARLARAAAFTTTICWALLTARPTSLAWRPVTFRTSILALNQMQSGQVRRTLYRQASDVFHARLRGRTIPGEFFRNGEARRGFGNILKFAFELTNMACHIFWRKAKRSKATHGKRS